LIHNQAF